MRIVIYLFSAVFLLAAIGEAADSPITALSYIVFGAGLIWLGRKQGTMKRSSISSKAEENKPIKITDSILELPSIGMSGTYVESPDGEYILVWSDSDPVAGVGGYRQSGHGSYALVHNNAVICHGKLQRPNDGKVAKDGTFILADWCFGDALKSRIFGFSVDGQEILRHEFSANAFNTGICETGKYAIIQLANSPSEDGGCLALFDLWSGKLLWKKIPETGWANSYRFDDTRRKIGLIYDKFGVYEYSYEGVFEDEEQWDQDRIKYGTSHDLLAVCKKKFEACTGQMSMDYAKGLLEIIERAVAKKEIQSDLKTMARALRMAGEIHEKIGELNLAVEKYQSAIKLDPKVGVKRKIQRLKSDH